MAVAVLCVCGQGSKVQTYTLDPDCRIVLPLLSLPANPYCPERLMTCVVSRSLHCFVLNANNNEGPPVFAFDETNFVSFAAAAAFVHQRLRLRPILPSPENK
jgi:hypothetical protein